MRGSYPAPQPSKGRNTPLARRSKARLRWAFAKRVRTRHVMSECARPSWWEASIRLALEMIGAWIELTDGHHARWHDAVAKARDMGFDQNP